MAERRTLNLKNRQQKDADSSTKRKKASTPAPEEQETKVAKKAPPKRQQATAQKSRNDLLDDLEDEEDDEELLLEDDGKNHTPLLFGVIVVLVVLVVIVAFLLLSGRNKNKDNDDKSIVEPPQQSQGSDVSEPDPLAGLGTQDFTQNTNMTTSGELVNPDEYLEDIHGLTLRVDYTVKSINYIADFVQYEKRRGTWGGGLELYWLDCTYQNNKYVIQIPFQYYKELRDVGTVPVKMEVLFIAGSAEGQTLNVISYMTLDEVTLKDILKDQAKTTK